jgi:hypothetical protein
MSGATDSQAAPARVETVVGPSDRSFGITFAAIFALVALYPLPFGGAPHLWAVPVAAAFAALAWLRPALLAPLNRTWLRFGLLLHRVVNPVVMALMFFAVVTPFGLAMRLFGRRPLAEIDPSARSYWVERTPPGPEPASMRKQF